MSERVQLTRNEELPRGKACLECRRKKIRCDGKRPVCTPCNRLHRPVDCEYTDGGRVPTQLLEDEVARLEARLRELETPATGSSIVILTEPYSTNNVPVARASGSHTDSIKLTNFITSLQYSSNPLSAAAHIDGKSARILVNVVLQHATQLNFALDIQRFRNLLDLPETSSSYPHPVLLNSLFVWALMILNADSKNMEPIFLNRAKLALTEALGNSNLSIRLQTIQAEILLAEYYFSLGRSVEGQYHATGAANLTISAGLHQIHPVSRNIPRGGITRTGDRSIGGRSAYFSLPPPQSCREEAERIRLFWAVYNLDKSWSVAIGSPSNITEDGTVGTQINTPWPPEIGHIEKESIPTADGLVRKTVLDFLAGRHSRPGGASTATLRAQVSALLDCVSSTMTSNVAPAKRNSIHDLEKQLVAFMQALPSLDSLSQISPDKRVLHLVIRSLAHTANILLRTPRAPLDHDAYTKLMASARDIVKIAELMVTNDIKFVDPIIAVNSIIVLISLLD
ncbi:hypothetical protein BD410DRAFT_843321 [Rickenella mellea]|uniref:Zn(2)-C6 fungal-type domain-containing protein n=1 Tax=Rickenella mellea TaxID=50990 RepID=A0A4Y7PTK0_9AGAM|nr:hypothetical protein BD410DRAFT_843321 [Rickenella mellea]